MSAPAPTRSFSGLRHGATDWNRQGLFQGRTDNPLNEDGLRRVFDTNIIAYMLMAQAALPHLEAARGTVITISADGSDEREAIEALAALVASGFGEDTCGV